MLSRSGIVWSLGAESISSVAAGPVLLHGTGGAALGTELLPISPGLIRADPRLYVMSTEEMRTSAASSHCPECLVAGHLSCPLKASRALGPSFHPQAEGCGVTPGAARRVETAPHPQDRTFGSLRKATPFSSTRWRRLIKMIKINLFLKVVSPFERHKAASRNSGLLGGGRARGDFALP